MAILIDIGKQLDFPRHDEEEFTSLFRQTPPGAADHNPVLFGPASVFWS
ncbi:MAG: hypothetical protein MK133_17550 [Planctomycetes bacterium]|nr:hypothetical protein [Planctomycetota bacterium]